MKLDKVRHLHLKSSLREEVGEFGRRRGDMIIKSVREGARRQPTSLPSTFPMIVQTLEEYDPPSSHKLLKKHSSLC